MKGIDLKALGLELAAKMILKAENKLETATTLATVKKRISKPVVIVPTPI